MPDEQVRSRKRCSLSRDLPPGYQCHFDAEEGEEFCIFHLPLEKKEPAKFWKHLASYIRVLLEKAGTEDTQKWAQNHPSHWIFEEADQELVQKYAQQILPGSKWDFADFIFPEMDENHWFNFFPFPAVDFSGAQFMGDADFSTAQFLGAAYFFRAQFQGFADFQHAQFQGTASFSEAQFQGTANFCSAQFKCAADFSWAEFQGDAKFWEAQFRHYVDFRGARFQGDAVFLLAQFQGDAHFQGAQFQGAADFQETRFQNYAGFLLARFQGNAKFREAQFQDNPDFMRARFQDDADFRDVQFQRAANFSAARFQGAAYFSGARFQDAANFSAALFLAPAYFIRAKINNLMNFSSITLRNRLLFAGTDFGDNARILLWNIDFVYGTSDIKMDNSHTKGQIIEPAGQVVFQDIPKGMNQVSFFHTDILTDRLCVRFSNVKWERDAKKFIFDAKFAFIKPGNWNTKTLETETGLPEDVINKLPQIFFVATPGQKGGADKEENIKKCEPLIKEDVERIAREIRLSYEKYGNYPEAGDYYIAEMDYKREKTSKKPLRPFLFWLALSLYKWVSNYGESPSLALGWILGLLGLPWLIIGLIRWQGICQFFNFCGYVLANMIALQAPAQELLGEFNCSFLWMVHKIFGITVITLFLLAIRRRFRR